jgi:VanZ family protein
MDTSDEELRAPRRPRATAIVAWALTVAWMGLIFYLSSLSGSEVPSGPSVVGHFAVYAILGGLFAVAIGPAGGWRVVAASVALAAVYALTDEFHQSFVPGRDPSLVDWLTDVAGAAAGATLVVLVARGAARRRPRREDSGPHAG